MCSFRRRVGVPVEVRREGEVSHFSHATRWENTERVVYAHLPSMHECSPVTANQNTSIQVHVPHTNARTIRKIDSISKCTAHVESIGTQKHKDKINAPKNPLRPLSNTTS